ncbi:MAG: hypothetical protein AAGI03_02110 [Pseudomonadota bacterium]
MDSATASAFDWSFDFLARTLAGLVESLGFDKQVPELMSRAAWRKALREVRCLEALARRLILVLSGDVVLGETVGSGSPKSAPRRKSEQPEKRHAPGIRLLERSPDPWLLAFGPAESTSTSPSPERPPPSPAVYASGLAARLNALKALVDNPHSAARRVALLRRRGGPKGRSVLISLIRYPGRGRVPADLLEDTIWLAHQMAVAELNRRCSFLPKRGPPYF